MSGAPQLRTVEAMCRANWPVQQRPTEARRATLNRAAIRGLEDEPPGEEAVVLPRGHGQNRGPGGDPHEGNRESEPGLELGEPPWEDAVTLPRGQNRGHPCHLCPGEGGQWSALSALGTIRARTHLVACPTAPMAMCHCWAFRGLSSLLALGPILEPSGRRRGHFVGCGGQGGDCVWHAASGVCAFICLFRGNRAQSRPHARPTGLHEGNRPKRVELPWTGLRSVVLESPRVAKGGGQN
jgi:hypothetical protein